MVYIYGRGLGLSPNPVRAQIKTYCNSNKFNTIYIIRNNGGHTRLGGPSQGSSPARRSRGRVLPTTQILTNARVTRGGPCLGHVSPIHSPQCHVSRNDSSTQLPPVRQLSSATSAYDSAMSAYDPATSASVRTVQSAHFFLHV
jgi:hypothetical protein